MGKSEHVGTDLGKSIHKASQNMSFLIQQTEGYHLIQQESSDMHDLKMNIFFCFNTFFA